jgi:hypothetical protein
MPRKQRLSPRELKGLPAEREYQGDGVSEWTHHKANVRTGNGFCCTEGLARQDGLKRGGPPGAIASQVEDEIADFKRKMNYVNNERRKHIESKIAAKQQTLARLRNGM